MFSIYVICRLLSFWFCFISECEKRKSAMQVLCTNTGRNTFCLKIPAPNSKHYMRCNLVQNFDCTYIPPIRPSFMSFFPSHFFKLFYFSYIFLFIFFKKFPFYFTLLSFFIVFCVPLYVSSHCAFVLRRSA